jgi:hypothetical protein
VKISMSSPPVFGSHQMRWSLKKIKDHLWGSCESGFNTPKNWKPWCEPSSPLPIDEFVTSLSGRKRSPTLRSANDLRSTYSELVPDGCPYQIVRRAISYAVAFAFSEQQKAKQVADRFVPFLADAKKQQAEIDPLISSLIATLEGILRLPAVHASHNALVAPNYDRLSHVKTLAELLLSAKATLPLAVTEMSQQHSRLSQNPGDVWGIAFVSALGSNWQGIVGKKPSSSGLFPEFVEAAWASLEDPSPAMRSWESQIKTACLRNRAVWSGNENGS